jgi:hypothetical protein
MPSFPPSGDVSPLRGRVLDALIDEGYQPGIDEDGDVTVTVQGQLVFVRCTESMPPLMRVFGQWIIGDELPGGELGRLRAANAVTGAVNLIKATVHDDRLMVAVDMVVTEGLQLRPVLVATMDAVLGSVHTWHQTLLELAGE